MSSICSEVGLPRRAAPRSARHGDVAALLGGLIILLTAASDRSSSGPSVCCSGAASVSSRSVAFVAMVSLWLSCQRRRGSRARLAPRRRRRNACDVRTAEVDRPRRCSDPGMHSETLDRLLTMRRQWRAESVRDRAGSGVPTPRSASGTSVIGLRARRSTELRPAPRTAKRSSPRSRPRPGRRSASRSSLCSAPDLRCKIMA